MNMQELLNTIRDNASQTYQDRVPEATRTNIEAIQEVMSDPNEAVVANEFANALLNMIIKQVIITKLFSDPLKSLKKGTKPLGDTVEEIYTNFIKAKQYDPTGAELLERKLPDVKAIYHRENRRDKYKVTISPEQLYKAFASYDKLNSFIQSIINTLYNSSELDEFVLMKQLLKQALDNNAIVKVKVDDPLTSEANAKNFIKAVKTVSGGMEYPSTIYNAYLDSQDEDENPITTFSRKDEQILIIDNATNVGLAIDVLASTFNMSVSEFNDTRKIVIDAFPDTRIRACLVDERFFQVYDDLVTFRDFENGEGLYRNYYLHVWQTLAYSTLVNAVAFIVDDEPTPTEEYNVTYVLNSGITSSNTATKVNSGSSYETTLSGIEGTDYVYVIMGETEVTNDVYDSANHTINIPNVTGELTIGALHTFTITTNLASGITLQPEVPASVLGEQNIITTYIQGITTETVSVTMGGVDVTSDIYDSSNHKIETVVLGDIVISVQ